MERGQRRPPPKSDYNRGCMSRAFHYSGRDLYAEQVPVRQIADSYGTPLYIYSKRTLLENFHSYQKAFRGIPHLICFALKSNSHSALLRLLADEGSGADIVSGGELFRAMRAGIPAERIVFAGVGKTEREMQAALRAGILLFNVESAEELRALSDVAGQLKKIAPIAVRVNPDVEVTTHPRIATGRHRHKFGVALSEALDVYLRAQGMPHIKIEGIHMHLGSQIMTPAPFRTAIRKVLQLVDRLREFHIGIEYFDIGGGAAIRYRKADSPLKPSQLAPLVKQLWRSRQLQLIVEPGRSIVGDAGILITRVLYRKKTAGRDFIVVDAGMNDFLRPALYDAHHEILPGGKTGRNKITADVVGPVCETSDIFAAHRVIQECRAGDLLAITDCGAYGASMSSQYNSRRRSAEVLVDGAKVKLISRRETEQDLIRHEIV